MTSRLVRFSCLILLLASGPVLCRGSEPVELLDGMFAALGGREAIGELRSLSVEADCTGPGGRFRTRVESFRPGSVYFAQSADDQTTEIWSTSARTWRDDSETGTQDLGEGVRDFVRAHEFHLVLFELESRFSHHRLGERRLVQGQRCRSILMEDEAGHPASLCLAERDSLPLALELNPEDAQGGIEIIFNDWRLLEGLRYFFSFTLSEGDDRDFTYEYLTIGPNAVLAERFVPRAGPEEYADQEAILEILRSDRQAHLKTDAALLASHLAESLVEISNGEIHVRSRLEVETFFKQYFEGAVYLMWEDIQPPLIRFSSDLTMAWVVRMVRVRRTSRETPGEAGSEEFSSAYTSTYEKRGGAWKMTSVTSTVLQT